ncbi:hypothetical protein Poly51_49520 [Rubripirellula tenax]|uniref:Uncharacterized protein n=1 Tax=Rubripirellula tenax TaxID=2528015 RepID=A0A5C6EFB8_9BACT|nr:hypothetical protein Poly51_49520 [Rubripirellula tenax]
MPIGTKDCTKASPRDEPTKVCRRPSVKTMLCGLRIWDSEIATDFPGKMIGDFTMTRQRRPRASHGLAPPRMTAALADQNATVVHTMSNEVATFHGWIATSS